MAGAWILLGLYVSRVDWDILPEFYWTFVVMPSSVYMNI